MGDTLVVRAFLGLSLTLLAMPAAATGRDGDRPQLEPVSVQRTIMPDSLPSAFAVGFAAGPSLCYDPVRGGVNYIWTGEFLDFTPARTGKHLQPARVLGDIFYRETWPQPLRRGSPGRLAELKFKGYQVSNGAARFQYLLDGLPVEEEIRPLPSGKGILRTFRVPPNSGPYWFLTGGESGAQVSSPSGKTEAGAIRMADGRHELSIEIQPREAAR